MMMEVELGFWILRCDQNNIGSRGKCERYEGGEKCEGGKFKIWENSPFPSSLRYAVVNRRLLNKSGFLLMQE